MVLTSATLDLAKESGLDVFDNITHAALGTGTSTPAISDTDVETQVGGRILVTSTKDVANDRYEFEVTLPIGFATSNTLVEIGLFDASTGGGMYARLLLDVSLVQDGDNEHVVTLRLSVDANNN